MENDLKKIATDFINTLQHRKSAEEILQFYHPEIEQVEFPNTLTRFTTIRNLKDLEEASEKGKKVLQKEHYDVIRSYSFDDTVIIEATWTATLAVPIGDLPIGGEMKAYFAQFYEFKDGKIFRQRNYDCFEPFS